MRIFFILPAFLIVFCACGAFAQDAGVKTPLTPKQFREASPLAGSEELDLEGFLALQKQGPVAVLDVRANASFAASHLKDSTNIPLTELTEETLPARIPDKNMPVVLVCDNSFQPVRMLAMTLQAYPVLKASGYKNIYRLNLWQNGKNGLLPMEEIKKQLDFEGSEERPQGVMCTMDAKLCPDGSYVSRSGPHCEFAACP